MGVNLNFTAAALERLRTENVMRLLTSRNLAPSAPLRFIPAKQVDPTPNPRA